jgi:NitT/TauT family transport system permease protein
MSKFNFISLNIVLTKRQQLYIAVGGLIFFLLVWYLITKTGLVSSGVLPSPWDVTMAFVQLLTNQDEWIIGNLRIEMSSLIYNTGYSIVLNVVGYLEAIIASLLFGFLIGLFPFFRSLLSRYIDAIRFIPLAAVTGLFVAWFGIEFNMKMQFLAFGIFVFLLPVVVQRIDEVDKIYKQTAYTLGATDWQTIRYVYWPHVLSKLIDDIRVLTAISWTYIIVAELINAESGIGKLIHMARRQSQLDQVFALLIVIILVGILQDILFRMIDKKINPFKYVRL